MKEFKNELVKSFTKPGSIKKHIKMFLALLLIAATYNLFVCSINLVAGGSGGVGVLFKYLFSIDPSIVVFVLALLMFILAFIFLDADQVISALIVTIFYPLMIKLTSPLVDVFSVDTSHVLIIVLFGAILTGIGQGIIFRLGYNIGGLSIIAKVVYKYTNISVTFVNAIINTIIVLLGGAFLGITMVLYAIIFIVILRAVSEKILIGISKNKMFKIVSCKYEKIEDFIQKQLGHDVTIYDAQGGYKAPDIKLIMAVVPTGEFTILKDFVKSVDKKAFIFITDTYDVGGQDLTISKSEC